MTPTKLQRLTEKVKTATQPLLDWLRRNWLFVVLALGGAFTAAKVIRRKTNVVNTVDAALEVQRAKSKILELSRKQSMIEAEDSKKADEVFRINGQIVEQQKVIAETVTGKDWKKLTDQEIFKALREAGL